MNIKYRKREKTPKYIIEQQIKAKKRSRKLVNQLYNTKSLLVINDKKYFCFAGDNIHGNSGYYTNNKKTCPESVRFIGKEKFPKKLLMWIAISDRAMSEPLFCTSKAVAINSSIYINECLEKRLLPFIHKYHGDFNYLFWPDLASSHYSKDSLNWMDTYWSIQFRELLPLIKNTIPQMCLKHDQLKIFGDIWHRRFTREIGKLQQSKF